MGKILPIIGITMGDPASIGPEIAAKIFANRKIYDICRPILIGDAAVMEQAVRIAKVGVKIKAVSQLPNATFQNGIMDVFDLKNVDLSMLKLGSVSPQAGQAAFESIKKVIELAMNNEVQATVTGPIHKEAINEAGHHFSGHTEIYAHYTHTTSYAMLLVHESMRVIHVSTHVSLRKACDLVKKNRIIEVVHLLDRACRQFGVENPHIGVAGLNPHASDGGLFGREEEEEIIPAVGEAIRKGYSVEGPVPADTLFAKAKGGLYDGCVAMYHDQGHIPFKLEGFTWDPVSKKMQSVKGVNITVGLPIIRTSVDHGTAFEIAGQGIASPDALQLAVEYAATMAQNPRN
jgi:4-hydroxythreonine-4-phosphate dehydrogenase